MQTVYMFIWIYVHICLYGFLSGESEPQTRKNLFCWTIKETTNLTNYLQKEIDADFNVCAKTLRFSLGHGLGKDYNVTSLSLHVQSGSESHNWMFIGRISNVTANTWECNGTVDCNILKSSDDKVARCSCSLGNVELAANLKFIFEGENLSNAKVNSLFLRCQPNGLAIGCPTTKATTAATAAAAGGSSNCWANFLPVICFLCYLVVLI